MRTMSRVVAFLLTALLAVWFTAENAGEMVRIDLVFLRVRASLPLVVFGSILMGLGAATFVSWRAERRERRALATADRAALRGTPDLSPWDDLGARDETMTTERLG